MRRGDVVVAVTSGDYGKPRPAVVVQSDAFAGLDSVIVCPLTSDLSVRGMLRVPVAPDPSNGLEKPSLVMVEKINALSRGRCRDTIGRLADAELAAVDRALGLILGQDGSG